MTLATPVAHPTERFRTLAGGRIDRSRRWRFTFDGRALTGHPGDTLASALLANGIHLAGRSFKYHRPRGILAAGSEEPNALVTVKRGWMRDTPNLRATEVELYDGLEAWSQNRWPSLGLDVASIAGRLGALLPAGFYYKTFMGPKWLGPNAAWTRLYEPAIRRMAGLGRAPATADPDRYASRFAHCDVLVVGAGPAGLAAARAAADTGASVIIADEQAEPGGSLLARPDEIVDGRPAPLWLSQVATGLSRHANVRLLQRTTVFGCYPDHLFGLAERLSDHLAVAPAGLPRERLWQVRASAVVVAAGGIERPLVFPGNDRPGIMLAGAVATYLHRYGVLAGTRAAIVTADDTGYAIAVDLAHHGICVSRIIDQRPAAGAPATASAAAAGIAVTAGAGIAATQGRFRVRAIDISHPDGRMERLPVDLVAMSGGYTPTVHLASQLRAKLAWDAKLGAFRATDTPAGVHIAGGAAGAASGGEAIAQGALAGEAAGKGRRSSATPRATPSHDQGGADAPPSTDRASVRLPPPPIHADAFVDFQNDVTTRDLALAAQEGFRSIEHVKRYTTTGMATDQGKTSSINALVAVGAVLGVAPPAVGHTTFRPPYTPVTFGTLAGESRGPLFEPMRRTAIDAAGRQDHAVFEDVGQWRRARFYPRPGEDMMAAVARECLTVRTCVGVFDASTLGKIEVVGPDAQRFLDRLYVNALGNLAVGRCRYAILLTEAGFVMDDGIVARLAPDRFHVTTTSAGAARVLAHMEDYLQTEFGDCRCWLTSITEQWSTIAVQGPKAREVLAPLIEGFDMAASALPHMGQGEGRILGAPMRLFRVSFTGELGFEVNVPSGYAPGVWDAIRERAERAGGALYGTEAMHVLRAEKGFIIVGQESDGTVTPGDLGLPTGDTKPDFVGKRSLARPDMRRTDRPHLVGLDCADPTRIPDEGAQIVATADPPTGTHALGYVTSAYADPSGGSPIVLALLEGGRQRIGEMLFVTDAAGSHRVRVTAAGRYDREGKRIHG